MVVPENEELDLNEVITKFGVMKEGDPDTFDEIAKIVFDKSVAWEKNPNTDADNFPFKANVDSKSWKLRINDFPDEPMYTLFIENKAIITFDDRPDTWVIQDEAKTS